MMTQRDIVLWRQWLDAWEITWIVIAAHMREFGEWKPTYVYSRTADRVIRRLREKGTR